VDDFVRKSGTVEAAQGRKCLCNSLLANIGLGQIRSATDTELALLTAGDDVADIARFLKPGQDSYSTADVVAYLLAGAA